MNRDRKMYRDTNRRPTHRKEIHEEKLMFAGFNLEMHDDT